MDFWSDKKAKAAVVLYKTAGERDGSALPFNAAEICYQALEG